MTVCLLVHGAAVRCILVGGDQLVHLDSDGGQGAVQLLNSLLRHGRLPAHDPGELHMQNAEVGAAVDQRVVVVVGGQHPVRGGRRVWRCERTRVLTKLHLHELLKTGPREGL